MTDYNIYRDNDEGLEIMTEIKNKVVCGLLEKKYAINKIHNSELEKCFNNIVYFFEHKISNNAGQYIEKAITIFLKHLKKDSNIQIQREITVFNENYKNHHPRRFKKYFYNTTMFHFYCIVLY